jgi:hypothetical protein
MLSSPTDSSTITGVRNSTRPSLRPKTHRYPWFLFAMTAVSAQSGCARPRSSLRVLSPGGVKHPASHDRVSSSIWELRPRSEEPGNSVQYWNLVKVLVLTKLTSNVSAGAFLPRPASTAVLDLRTSSPGRSIHSMLDEIESTSAAITQKSADSSAVPDDSVRRSPSRTSSRSNTREVRTNADPPGFRARFLSEAPSRWGELGFEPRSGSPR